MQPRDVSAKFGYRAHQWAHGPRWDSLPLAGERWFGFAAVRAIAARTPEVLLVPLVGHSEGHCGVAVRDGEGWLLHAGDAYFSHREIAPHKPRSPLGLALFQRLRAVDNAARLTNQARLRQLAREHGDQVRIFSAHCATEFERFPSSAARAVAAE